MANFKFILNSVSLIVFSTILYSCGAETFLIQNHSSQSIYVQLNENCSSKKYKKDSVHLADKIIEPKELKGLFKTPYSNFKIKKGLKSTESTYSFELPSNHTAIYFADCIYYDSFKITGREKDSVVFTKDDEVMVSDSNSVKVESKSIHFNLHQVVKFK
jgi:hypothetical protein